MTTRFQTGGLVLAAGASSRMGVPKALLALPDGTPLAAHQATHLAAAGCDPVRVVLGAEGVVIAPQLPSCTCVQHPGWPAGRFSSLQAGLRALGPMDGVLVLPVDTVGVRAGTLRAVRSAAESERPAALRPWHAGQPGRVLWLRGDTAAHLLARPADDLRVDELLRALEQRFDVDDPGLLANINTPDAWTQALAALAPELGGAQRTC